MKIIWIVSGLWSAIFKQRSVEFDRQHSWISWLPVGSSCADEIKFLLLNYGTEVFNDVTGFLTSWLNLPVFGLILAVYHCALVHWGLSQAVWIFWNVDNFIDFEQREGGLRAVCVVTGKKVADNLLELHARVALSEAVWDLGDQIHDVMPELENEVVRLEAVDATFPVPDFGQDLLQTGIFIVRLYFERVKWVRSLELLI